jgi:CheY-like chemotaxis protein
MSRPFHIVLADDDNDDQFIIKEAIREYNVYQIEVTSVTNGEELLSYLSSSTLTPDLILLDINMPKVDGLQALEQVKANGKTKNIPVYMISTMHTPQRYDASMKLGARNYYTKPNKMDGYKQVIGEVLNDVMKTDNL